VLLSAYACEPEKGSEPAVGWHWALEIARLGHEVWVLTRANNRTVIQTELARSPPLKNLKFLYYDLPPWAKWWKKGQRGTRLYYQLWQWGAYLLAKRVHGTECFDRVHHVTFVSVRQASFMGNLGIPFVFGPVAGGERAPWHLRSGYSLRGWLADGVRDLANILVKIDPLVRRTFKQAECIYVTSEQTLSLLPRKYQSKALVQLAIGFDTSDLPPWSDHLPSARAGKDGLSVLYVGRLLYWKGMHLGLPAFARLLEERPNARLTIVGRGPDKRLWQSLAKKLGLAERINWIPWLDRKELSAIYASHDVFLFPSLHDSGGMVVLEAMANGLPVVSLNLGGPGIILSDSCGHVIDSSGLTKNEVVDALAKVLIELSENDVLLEDIRKNSRNRANRYSWKHVVRRVYQPA